MLSWKQFHNEPLPETLPRSSSRCVHFSVPNFIVIVIILSAFNLAGLARADTDEKKSKCAQIEDDP
ncbi:MAG TPA: hypothetical protein VMW89_18465 [Desulfatiglandales bacterium]|nr:hypothetical protein [Desulfatiglandales bacterium]